MRTVAPELRLIAAPFTPFGPDADVALSVVDEQARALRRDGVDGAFVCGTTGEGLALTVAERMAVAERWVQTAGGLEVIVHVGHTSLTEATALARHAADSGAAAIAAIPPFFHRPDTVEDLVEYCAAIAAAAPGLRFFYYHIPHLTRVELPMPRFLELARRTIPNLGGIKFTDDDLYDYAACLELAGDDHEVFFGRDELLLGALSYGARSAVGSTYNFAAALYRDLAAAFHAGELERARELQRLVRNVVAAADREGGLAALKRIAGARGPDLGPCRPPLRTLDEESTQRLTAHLGTSGFLEALDRYGDTLPTGSHGTN